MGIVIGAVAVVFVLALIIFPGVRGKLKVLVGGFLNIFVEDIAKTPEGAKAVFQQAIEEVQERYNKAGDTLNRFVGEQSSVQKNLNKLYGELKDVESKCESLVRSGNMADAAIFSTTMRLRRARRSSPASWTWQRLGSLTCPMQPKTAMRTSCSLPQPLRA